MQAYFAQSNVFIAAEDLARLAETGWTAYTFVELNTTKDEKPRNYKVSFFLAPKSVPKYVAVRTMPGSTVLPIDMDEFDRLLGEFAQEKEKLAASA